MSLRNLRKQIMTEEAILNHIKPFVFEHRNKFYSNPFGRGEELTKDFVTENKLVVVSFGKNKIPMKV